MRRISKNNLCLCLKNGFPDENGQRPLNTTVHFDLWLHRIIFRVDYIAMLSAALDIEKEVCL